MVVIASGQAPRRQMPIAQGLMPSRETGVMILIAQTALAGRSGSALVADPSGSCWMTSQAAISKWMSRLIHS